MSAEDPGAGHRSVDLERVSRGHYRLRNERGGCLVIGDGSGEEFTPVELLLAAIAGCSSVDVDLITSRRAEPEEFTVLASGEKASEPGKGNHMTDIEVTFRVRFPEGEGGDAAREAFPRSVAQSRDRLCTVSRTVQLGTPVQMSAEDL
ncbi:OsmC family protein [Janibacter corallicola]|uniref:OsmC family protein n=1 Tax=Janibacter corallicola TaxID=415212 RepID=UPI00082F5BC7|nr:OsmC family protein [Janibacter corallicola]